MSQVGPWYSGGKASIFENFWRFSSTLAEYHWLARQLKGLWHNMLGCTAINTKCHVSYVLQKWYRYIGQFQVTVFSRFCYVLLCNHEYIHCLNHRQAKDYITRRNETERKTLIWKKVLCTCLRSLPFHCIFSDHTCIKGTSVFS